MHSYSRSYVEAGDRCTRPQNDSQAGFAGNNSIPVLSAMAVLFDSLLVLNPDRLSNSVSIPRSASAGTQVHIVMHA